MVVHDPVPSLADSLLELVTPHTATDAIAALALALAVTMRGLHAYQPADGVVLELIDDLDALAAHAARSSRLSRASAS